MSRRYITAIEERQIIERANRLCEYCRSSMDYSAQPFVIDHIIPIAEGGKTDLENLAFACGGCNGHKYTKIQAIDPVSREVVSLYNPRQQNWRDNFVWSDDFLQVVGLTAIARATINELQLNRSGVVNMRRLLLIAGLHPPIDK
jgi:hypothetical protein